jgi:lysozyme
MKLSKAGLAALSVEEGLVLHPYNDSAGNATIGVGHLIHLGPVTAADQARYRGFTRAQAIALLANDVAKFETAVNRTITKPMLQGQFDAFVSLAFNIGTGGFATSTTARRFNAGDRTGAANAFLLWSHPPELMGRRKRERAMFLAAKPTDALAGYTAHERYLIRTYDGLVRARTNAPRRLELRQEMLEQRKRIWHAAQPRSRGGDGHGWSYARRDARYHSLRARST